MSTIFTIICVVCGILTVIGLFLFMSLDVDVIGWITLVFAIVFLGLFSLLLIDTHCAKVSKVTTYEIVIDGKRQEVVGRYTTTKYFVVDNNSKEWQVKGADYAKLEKGDTVTVYRRYKTSCIFKEEIYSEDWG